MCVHARGRARVCMYAGDRNGGSRMMTTAPLGWFNSDYSLDLD